MMCLGAVIVYAALMLLLLAILRAAGQADQRMEELMKTCEVCGKKSLEPLQPRLMMGKHGYRTYNVCLICQKSPSPKPRKATSDERVPVGTCETA